MSDSGQRIDWEDVRRRLLDSQQALDRALNTDAETLAAVYRQRAAQLAGRRGSETTTASLRVLVFTLGTERFALELSDLVELRPFAGCAAVPGGPSQLLGVINIHGEIRSVVDLGRLLELPQRDAIEGGYVLLVRRQGRETGLRVDSVDDIQSLAPDQLTVPEAEAGGALRYLKGLAPDRLRLLDAQAILAHPIYNRQDG